MSGSGLVSFHIAYVPDDEAPKRCNGDLGNGHSITIRRASSIRLHRCRGHHVHVDAAIGQGEHFRSGNSSGVSSAASSEHRVDDECHCCCCRAERYSPDSLLPCHPSASDGTEKTYANSMLAVLVPSSLTQSLVNAVNGTNDNNLAEQSQRLNDAEAELRKSIHPCLCPNGATQYNGENERKSDQQEQTVEEQLFVCGVVTSNDVTNVTRFPADVVLLAARIRDGEHLISQYSNLLNHETASDAPWSVLKAFPVSTLSILPKQSEDTNGTATINTRPKGFDIAALPCCPVCMNLIEPARLGLPGLKQHHKCSRWCSSSSGFLDHNGFTKEHPCVNETKFLPWPPPAECAVCQQRVRSMDSNASALERSVSMDVPFSLPLGAPQPNQNNMSASLNHVNTEHMGRSHPLTCNKCSHSTTLWVCLTCGIVGCGRYTLKHAAEHYALEGHPYSLELATGRIWDYENGNFVHRRDLVECPVLSTKWGIAVAGGESASASSPLVAPSSPGTNFRRGNSNISAESGDRKEWRKQESVESLGHNGYYDGLEDSVASCRNGHNQHTSQTNSKLSDQPKKSIMISQEYEALLQSALEDQAQHYEGELSRLRAELASSRLRSNQISDRESREIRALQKDSERLKQDVERLSSALLDAQAIEAKHRSMSQRLLREQSISKELLEKIRKETLAEHESGKLRMEDLTMQISDLSANLSMMSQFAKNEELSQAQIFGTIGGEETETKKRGKKSRRGRKK